LTSEIKPANIDNLMLEIENLSVEVDGKRILHHLNLTIAAGETHALFGPNASGKTTLLMTIMGFPQYKAKQGRILFKGRDITALAIDERARLGIGIAFQRPPAIRGVKVRDIARFCLHDRQNGELVEAIATKVNVTELLDREVNYGFSGGEIKCCELFQLTAQRPELILLDEPDSGVDLVNIGLVGKAINELLQTSAGLLITHTGHILNYVTAQKGHLLFNGKLCCELEPQELLATIQEYGYAKCAECPKYLSLRK